MSPAHILIYTDDPGEGGVAVYNTDLAIGLAAAGYRLTVAQSRPADGTVPPARPGIAHEWLPFHTRQDPGRNLTDVAVATSVLQRVAPDVVIFTNCAPLSQVAATHAAAESDTPYIIVEGYAAPYPTLTPELAWVLHHQRRLYEKARAVVAVSGDTLAILRSHFGLDVRKGEVIHYGRPARFFEKPEASQRLAGRQSLGIPADAVVCLTAARFAEVKGYAHLLAAIRHLRHRPEWQSLYFVWIGDGPLLKPFRDQIQTDGLDSHVKLVGAVSDVVPYLELSDVFALPSHYEGMPLAIMEAMAKGLAVAASRVSGIPEELGDTGRLLPDPKVDSQATVAALVSTLSEWATDRDAIAVAGQACRARASRLFRQERMLEQTRAVIERARLPVHDYVSPGLEVIRLDSAFPHLALASPETLAWEHLRDDIPHAFYIDARAPGTGFLNRDEAILLYNLALLFRGKPGLEVGCWLGWSAAHIAAAGVRLDVIDPVLANPSFSKSVTQSLVAAALDDLVTLHAASSPEAIGTLAALGRRWEFIFIDGNHEAPHPTFDAAAAAEYAAEDAMVVFHDLASPDVAQGLHYLQCRGWSTKLYHTAQVMGVAYRGGVVPVTHVPDPRITWRTPKHLRRFE